MNKWFVLGGEKSVEKFFINWGHTKVLGPLSVQSGPQSMRLIDCEIRRTPPLVAHPVYVCE